MTYKSHTLQPAQTELCYLQRARSSPAGRQQYIHTLHCSFSSDLDEEAHKNCSTTGTMNVIVKTLFNILGYITGCMIHFESCITSRRVILIHRLGLFINKLIYFTLLLYITFTFSYSFSGFCTHYEHSADGSRCL